MKVNKTKIEQTKKIVDVEFPYKLFLELLYFYSVSDGKRREQFSNQPQPCVYFQPVAYIEEPVFRDEYERFILVAGDHLAAFA